MLERFAVLCLLALVCGSCGRPEESPPTTPGPPAPVGQEDWREAARSAVSRGAEYLWASAEDGKWSFKKEAGPDLGISAIALRAILLSGVVDAQKLKPSLDWLVSHQKEDGGIYENALATYYTSSALLALKAADDPAHAGAIAKGSRFLARIQSDEGEGLDESSEDYGGVGYGGSGVVNMSTTQMAIEAASEAGLPKDDAFYSKALRFLQRSHNRSESNDQKHVVDGVEVVPGNDGGGIYRPAESKAGLADLPGGRKAFRSYGSMTYALLKSYLLCELDARDARVQAALRWIGNNWETAYNPGMEHAGKPEARYQGLYYYYLTVARTLGVAEAQKVTLEASDLKEWRAKLARAIIARQAENGSWANHEGRWWESNPALASGYALLALEACLKTP